MVNARNGSTVEHWNKVPLLIAAVLFFVLER
jgi:hypothetical protein